MSRFTRFSRVKFTSVKHLTNSMAGKRLRFGFQGRGDPFMQCVCASVMTFITNIVFRQFDTRPLQKEVERIGGDPWWVSGMILMAVRLSILRWPDATLTVSCRCDLTSIQRRHGHTHRHIYVSHTLTHTIKHKYTPSDTKTSAHTDTYTRSSSYKL